MIIYFFLKQILHFPVSLEWQWTKHTIIAQLALKTSAIRTIPLPPVMTLVIRPRRHFSKL